jgi:hypothetical protein
MSTILGTAGTRRAWHHATTTVLHHAVCVCLVLAATVPAAAQTTLGTIRGTVVDPQQNIVPGATVVVTDESTSVRPTVKGCSSFRTCAPGPIP